MAAPWPERHVANFDTGLPVPFHVGQDWAWDCEARTVGVLAGYQSGKTVFAPHWLRREVERCSSGDYLAVTSTYDLFKLKFLPAMLQMFEEKWRIGRYWAGDKILELRDPSSGKFLAQRATDRMWARIILRSADSRGGLEASTCKAAVLDEAGQETFGIEAKRGVDRRLAVHRGRKLITTTLYNLEWVKQQVLDVAVAGGISRHYEAPNGGEVTLYENVAASVAVVQMDNIVNPAFPVGQWEEDRATLPSDVFEMMSRGRASKPRTLIYDCFDELRNRTAAFKVPLSWPCAVAVDPVGEEVAALFVAWDAEGERLHVFDEYGEPFGLSTPEHARNVLGMAAGHRVAAWVVGQPSERQFQADWRNAGVPAVAPPFSDLWLGIGKVYSLMKSGALVIHDNCERTLDQVGRYQKKVSRDGEPTDEIKDKERFHYLDCLRYAVAWLTAPREQTEVVYDPVRIGRY